MNFEIRYLKSVPYQFYNESCGKRFKLSKVTAKKKKISEAFSETFV